MFMDRDISRPFTDRERAQHCWDIYKDSDPLRGFYEGTCYVKPLTLQEQHQLSLVVLATVNLANCGLTWAIRQLAAIDLLARPYDPLAAMALLNQFTRHPANASVLMGYLRQVLPGRELETPVMRQAVRDHLGEPWNPVTFRPSVRALADVRYLHAATSQPDSRGRLDPVALAMLADRLEEDVAPVMITDALRSPGPKFPGTWAMNRVRV